MNTKDFKKNLPWIIFIILIFSPFLKSNFFALFIAMFLIIYIYRKFNFNKIKYKNMNENFNQTIDMDKLSKLKSGKHFKKILFSVIVLIFLTWLFFTSIIIVEAGETGVYSLFGKVKDEELHSGFHLVIPLARVTKMSIRTEEYTMSIAQGEGKKYNSDAITSLTKEGLNIDLDITVLYRLNEEKASDVYRNVGLNYEEKIIRPSIRTAIRDVIAQYEAKDIYSEKRQEVAEKITEQLKGDLESRGIILEDVLLRNVVLPANLAQSIQEKLQAEQEAEKYDFLLAKEKKEKERKIIEAEGQRDAQSIINQSLTPNYLYYLYIRELKDREGTIYVPTNPDTGLPMFRSLGQ